MNEKVYFYKNGDFCTITFTIDQKSSFYKQILIVLSHNINQYHIIQIENITIGTIVVHRVARHVWLLYDNKWDPLIKAGDQWEQKREMVPCYGVTQGNKGAMLHHVVISNHMIYVISSHFTNICYIKWCLFTESPNVIRVKHIAIHE